MIKKLLSKTLTKQNIDYVAMHYSGHVWQNHTQLAMQLTNGHNTYRITNASVDITRMLNYQFGVIVFPLIVRDRKHNYLFFWCEKMQDKIITNVNISDLLYLMKQNKKFVLFNHYVTNDDFSSQRILDFIEEKQ